MHQIFFTERERFLHRRNRDRAEAPSHPKPLPFSLFPFLPIMDAPFVHLLVGISRDSRCASHSRRTECVQDFGMEIFITRESKFKDFLQRDHGRRLLSVGGIRRVATEK